MRIRTRNALLAVGVFAMVSLCGCAKTGLAWVHEPQRVEYEHAGSPKPPAPETTSEKPAAAPLPVRKTVTLGEVVTSGEEAQRAQAQPPEPVVIRMSEYAQPLSYGVVGALEVLLPDPPVLVDPDPIVVPQRPPSGVQPGQDFPPPRSFGPPFP